MSHALNILLIDGNHEDRNQFRQLLKSCWSDDVIYEAATGHRGLDMYESNSIDCVILELELPDMSGLEVLIKLVPLAEHPEVPVIVLTRLNFVSLMQLALLNGAYLCLYKDMSPSDLLHTAILQATSALRSNYQRASLPNTSSRLDRAA